MTSGLRILVTGASGFIGWKVCEFLLTKPNLLSNISNNDIGQSGSTTIVGLDNMNDYYDVRLKQWRLDQLKKHTNFHFHEIDIESHKDLSELFEQYADGQNLSEETSAPSKSSPQPPFAAIINLAARAGVRYSMVNPFVYFRTNVIGNLNLLELCRKFGVKKYVMASTSSLYAGQKMPFSEELPVNQPISPYAASKKGAEVTCYTYHKLYGMDITVLRYFTVYGPAGRPDMSIFRFVSWLDRGVPVQLFGDGSQSRDFTYVDDIARGTILALTQLGFKVINLGGDAPYKLIDVLKAIEDRMGAKADIVYKPFHPADILATHADIKRAKEIINWYPKTNLNDGLKATVDWYLKNKSWASSIEL